MHYLTAEQYAPCRSSARQYSQYLVGSSGSVYSIRRQRYLVGTVDGDGYQRVLLTGTDGKSHCETVHRLVACSFLGQPEAIDRQYCIDHWYSCCVYRVPRNNSLHNLRWVTPSRNNAKRKRRQLTACQSTIQQNGTVPFLYKHEIFLCPHADFAHRNNVSLTNFGRVWLKKQGKFTRGYIHKTMYRRVDIDKKHYTVHRLMVECVQGRLCKSLVVCHTDDHASSKFTDGTYTNYLQTLRLDCQSANIKEYWSFVKTVRGKKKKITSSYTHGPTNYTELQNLIAKQDAAQTFLEPQDVPRTSKDAEVDLAGGVGV